MADPFDPYQQWLGISPKEQPPHHYRLLGLEPLEPDREKIQAAADAQVRRVNMYRRSANANRCDEVIYRIQVARACLLNPRHKTSYDRQFAAQYPTEVAAREQKPIEQKPLESAREKSSQRPSGGSLFDGAGGAPASQQPSAGRPSIFNEEFDPNFAELDAVLFQPGIAFPPEPGAADVWGDIPAEEEVEAALPAVSDSPIDPLEAKLPFACGYRLLGAHEELPTVAAEPGFELLPMTEAEMEPAPSPARRRRPWLIPVAAAALALFVALGSIGWVLGPALMASWFPAGPLGPIRNPRPLPTGAGQFEPPTDSAGKPSPAVSGSAGPSLVGPVLQSLRLESATLLANAAPAGIADRHQREAPADHSYYAGLVARDSLLWSQQAEQPSQRAEMLQNASRLAAAAGDMELARRALTLLSGLRPVDRWRDEADLLTTALATAKSPAQRRAWFESAAMLFHRALVEARFDDARSIVDVAARAGVGLSPAERTQVSEWSGQLRQVEEARDLFIAAQKQLRDTPDDPAASETVGAWLCLKQWDWPAGLPLFAKSNDPRLQTAAINELSMPTVADDQKELGELWWELAERTADAEAAQGMRLRAAYWYDRALQGEGLGNSRELMNRRLNAVGVAKIPLTVDPLNLADTWWKLAEEGFEAARATFERRAAYWYAQTPPEYYPAPRREELGARIRHLQQLPALDEQQTHSPWDAQLLWPVAFEERWKDPAAVSRFACALGQYGGDLEVEPSGVHLFGMQSTTALWLPEPVLDRCQLEAEVTRLGSGQFCIWLGGPGGGNAPTAGYCVRVGEKTVELLREGSPVAKADWPSPSSPRDLQKVSCRREGKRFVCELEGRPLLEWEDSSPLTGPLYSRIGVGCTGGRADAGFRLGPLRLRRPPMTLADVQALALPWVAPTLVAPAPTMQPPRMVAAPSDMLLEGWFHSQPDASVLLSDGRLLLSGPAAMPTVICRKPLEGDFAYNVAYQYIAPQLPRPRWDMNTSHQENFLLAGGEAANFRLMIVFAHELPGPDRFETFVPDLPAGWEVALPAGDGASTLAWIEGFKRQVLASTPYHAPPAGTRHHVRIEKRGGNLRVLLNGGLLLQAEHPQPAETNAFLGMRQVFGGSIVDRVEVWPLGATSADAPAGSVAGQGASP